MQATRDELCLCLGPRRAEGTGFGQCLSRRMLGLPRASVVPVLCSLVADVYPVLTKSSWRKKETKGSKLVRQLLTWDCFFQKWRSNVGRVKIPQKNNQVLPAVKHNTLKGTEDCRSKTAGHDIKGETDSVNESIWTDVDDQGLQIWWPRAGEKGHGLR